MYSNQASKAVAAFLCLAWGLSEIDSPKGLLLLILAIREPQYIYPQSEGRFRLYCQSFQLGKEGF